MNSEKIMEDYSSCIENLNKLMENYSSRVKDLEKEKSYETIKEEEEKLYETVISYIRELQNNLKELVPKKTSEEMISQLKLITTEYRNSNWDKNSKEIFEIGIYWALAFTALLITANL